MDKSVKIGNASGFWGDNPYALKQQLEGGDLDYITSDYLAELSMSILYKQQMKNPEMGFIPDFIDHLECCLDVFLEKQTKLITNAGGNNPKGLALRIYELFAKRNEYIKIAFIEGDNLIDNILNGTIESKFFKNTENNIEYEHIKSSVKSANAYTGFPSIIEALKSGAKIIICGRASDSAITIAPIVYEFGWDYEDYNKLGGAMIAAHVIECGTQATGGNFTDWESVKNWDNIGFPNIEVYEDGSFDIYKHPHTGGVVTVNSIKEQLVYEIENPKYYYSPDVISDMTSIKVSQKKEGVVHVSGGKGICPTPFYKLSMAYHSGYKASGTILLSGPNVVNKARCFERIIKQRFGTNYSKMNVEYIGYNSTHLNLIETECSNEIVLRAHVFDEDKFKIDTFRKQFTGLILSGPPGVTAFGGRPKRQDVLAYWPALIEKSKVPLKVSFLDEQMNEQFVIYHTDNRGKTINKVDKEIFECFELRSLNTYKGKKLQDFCLARSGDKGDSVNIGLIVRSEKDYLFIKEYLTESRLKKYFKEHCNGEVIRYELPNLNGFNFFLTQSLDGGGTVSMRADNQGKTFAQALLNQIIE